MPTSTTTNWADEVDEPEEDALPPRQVTDNPDGTKTIVSYTRNPDNGHLIRLTQRVKMTVHKEKVDPAVAERKKWTKFGLEKGHKEGPDPVTTSVGENMGFNLRVGWKASQEPEGGDVDIKDKLKDKKVVCRICKGEHFTAKCPFKDTLRPLNESESGTATPTGEESESTAPGGKSAYIAPHLRAGARPSSAAAGGGAYRERDDSATLRVTNISEDVTEDDLRALFSRFGPLQRVFLARDRETNRVKGFAFVSFMSVPHAEEARKRLDGYGLLNMIMHVEFSKKN